MKFKIVVDRMQYGVGQGGFHVQQIRVQADDTDVGVEPHRFVYDCGSDTAGMGQGKIKPLEWAIRHFAGRRRADAAEDKLVVNTLYLSHFQKDHIDGARRLAELVDLQEIVIPHVSREQLAHIVGQQVAMGNLAGLTPDVQEYLNVLGRAASGEGPIIGNVPTTRVQPGGEPPNPTILGGGAVPPRPPQQGEERVRGQGTENWGDVLGGHYQIQPTPGTAGMWQHQKSRLLQVAPFGAGASVLPAFWELRTWCYAQSAALSADIVKELRMLEGRGTRLAQTPARSN